jgi:radical SAM superfamily enzyme YgiQ (UPF0313 family)
MSYDIVLFVDSAIETWRMRSYGVHRLASELRIHGYSVKVIDWTCKIFEDYQFCNRLFKKIIGPNTLFAGFSASHFYKKTVNTRQFDHNDDYFEDQGTENFPYPGDQKRFEILVAQMKRINPKLKTVYGGSWVSDHLKLSAKIDYLVYGLGDSTIVEIADHLSKGTPLKFLPGACPGQRLIKHDEKGLSFDFPNSQTTYRPEDHIRTGEVLTLETSRGCMFKCKFCSFVLLGRKPTDPKYHKEVDVLAQELKTNWEQYRINRYFIVDDTFNESTEKIQSVADSIRLSGVPDFKFFAYLRMDLLRANPEQISLLKDMGLQAAYMGIESLNDQTLKIIGKPLSGTEVKKFLTELHHHWQGAVSMHGSFIIGLPHDTPERADEWMQWVLSHDCPLDSARTHSLNINPAWPNVFGLDMEKYGYRHPETPALEYWKNPNWTSEHWTRRDTIERSTRYGKEMFYSRRGRTQAWEIMGLQNSGYSFEYLYRRPRLDYDRIEMLKRVKNQFDQYMNDLCEYEGIER